MFDIAREALEGVQFDDILRKQSAEELEAERREQRNIDPAQIENGSGTIPPARSTFMVPNSVASSLNSIPNPDRNGLVLLWSYNLYKIFNGREEGILAVIRHLYGIGERSYSGRPEEQGIKRGRKKKDQERDGEASAVFNIKPEDIGFTQTPPSLMIPLMSEVEYARLLRFISDCMLPSIDSFQRGFSAGVIYKTVNFRNIALNLFKGTREISVVSRQGEGVTGS